MCDIAPITLSRGVVTGQSKKVDVQLHIRCPFCKKIIVNVNKPVVHVWKEKESLTSITNNKIFFNFFIFILFHHRRWIICWLKSYLINWTFTWHWNNRTITGSTSWYKIKTLIPIITFITKLRKEMKRTQWENERKPDTTYSLVGELLCNK